MSNLDQPNSGKIFGNDGPQKLNAADFEIYAPRALAIADMHGEGIATKAEIQHMVAQPAPAEDAKTKESMKFLLDHYDFLHQMSHPVDVVYGKESDTTMPGEDRNLIQTKQGITPDAIGKVNDVLEGKRAPGRDQINFSDSDPMKWPLILGGIPATTISGWGLGYNGRGSNGDRCYRSRTCCLYYWHTWCWPCRRRSCRLCCIRIRATWLCQYLAQSD